MSKTDRKQGNDLARFLQTSRIHLELSERRQFSRLPNALGSLLIAGSLIGGAGIAQHELKSPRNAESRTERRSPDNTVTVAEPRARSLIERMP